MWHPVKQTLGHTLQARPRPSFAEGVSLGTQVPPPLPHSIPERGEGRGWGHSMSRAEVLPSPFSRPSLGTWSHVTSSSRGPVSPAQTPSLGDVSYEH